MPDILEKELLREHSVVLCLTWQQWLRERRREPSSYEGFVRVIFEHIKSAEYDGFGGEF